MLRVLTLGHGSSTQASAAEKGAVRRVKKPAILPIAIPAFAPSDMDSVLLGGEGVGEGDVVLDGEELLTGDVDDEDTGAGPDAVRLSYAAQFGFGT